MPLVFCNDEWIEVNPPIGHDPSWTDSDKWLYASSYAAAVAAGFPHARAVILAEALVHKQVYPGLSYSKSLEQELLSLSCASSS